MNTYEDFTDLVAQIVKGDTDAINFYHDIHNALHFWDDLIDKDKPIDDDTVHNVMDALIFRLPTNKFYAKNEHFLRPVLVSSIYNWMAATKMERNPKSDNDLFIAFITRSAYVDLLSIGAMLFHKRDIAVNMICEIRRYWHSEGFANYIQNLIQEKAARG